MSIHLITQNVVTRGHDVGAPARSLGWTHTAFVAAGQVADERFLAGLEAELAASGAFPVVFCSLQFARRIRRQHPRLTRGLFLNEGLLAWSSYAALIDPDTLLNGRGVILPWAHVPARASELGSLFGDQLFLRPNSPMKPFTGFSVSLDALAFEHAAHSQTDRIDPGELVVVCPAKSLASIEFRFWLIDGRISSGAPTGAAYGWDTESEGFDAAAEAPHAMVAAARRLAATLEPHENLLVADFVMEGDAPRLVELNPLSTSGFYEALQVGPMLADLGAILVP